MQTTLSPVVDYYVTHVLDAQLWLSHLIDGVDWNCNLTTGRLFAGPKFRWRSQFLGIEVEASHTWHWAWANVTDSIPAYLLDASLALKAYGEQHGIPELTTPELRLDQVNGHTLALIASGLCDANAYFHCPYEGGSLFVLIIDEDFPECPDSPLQRLATVFPQAIASLHIPDHRFALIGYLVLHNLAFRQDGDTIVVSGDDHTVLTATFDDQHRLTTFETTLNQQVAEPTESLDQFLLRLALRR